MRIKYLFFGTIIAALLLNIVPVYIFRDNAKITVVSFNAIMCVVLELVHGLVACLSKDANFFYLFRKYKHSRFWRYNKPTTDDMKEFWLKATIFFAPLPFYIPIALFSTKEIDSLWCLLLLFLPQFAFVGMEIHKMLREIKEQKLRRERLERERIEQERREELGNLK